MKTVLKLIALLVVVQWSCGVPLQSSVQIASDKNESRISPSNGTLRTSEKEKAIKVILAKHFNKTSEDSKTPNTSDVNVTSDEVWRYMREKGYVAVLPLAENEDNLEVHNDKSQLKNASNVSQNKSLTTRDIKENRERELSASEKEKIIKAILAKHFNKTSEDSNSETPKASDFNITSKQIMHYLVRKGHAAVLPLAESEVKLEADNDTSQLKNASNTGQNKSLITRDIKENEILVHCKLCNSVHAKNEECSKNKRNIIIIGEPGDNIVFKNTANSSILKDLINSKTYKKLQFREVVSESEKNIFNTTDDENLQVRAVRGSPVKKNKTATNIHKHTTTTATKTNSTLVKPKKTKISHRSIDSTESKLNLTSSEVISNNSNQSVNSSDVANRIHIEGSNGVTLASNETQNVTEKDLTNRPSREIAEFNSTDSEENSTVSRIRRNIMEHDHFKLNACESCQNSNEVTKENETHQIHAEPLFAGLIVNMTMLYCTCAIAKPSARDAEKEELILRENLLRLPTDQYNKELCLGVCMDSSRHLVNVHVNLYCSHSINEKTIPHKIENIESRWEWIFCQIFSEPDQSQLRAFLSWMNLAILDVMMCVTIIGLAGMYLIYFVFWKGNKPSSNYKKTTFSVK